MDAEPQNNPLVKNTDLKFIEQTRRKEGEPANLRLLMVMSQ
jgi:hypothetical protein